MKRNILLYFFVIIATSFVFSSCSLADNERKMVREGNKAYQDSIFDEAEVQYRKALDYNPTSFAANYNIANATYKQKNYKSAAAKYKRLLDSLETKEWKSSSNHNLGNSYLHSKEIDKAIAAYKEALRNNPDDKETKYNLMYAMNLKNQQEQQNKQDKQQQDKQENKQNQDQKQDQKSEQNNTPKDGDKEQKPQPKPNEDDQDNKNNGKKEQQDDNKKSEEDKNDEKKGKEKQNDKNNEQDKPNEEKPDKNTEKREIPVGISKENAENILDAIAVEEKDAQEKVQKDKARKKGRVRKQKNW